jgi:hypothetical protein
MQLIAAGQSWPVREVKSALNEGWAFGTEPPHFLHGA